MNGPVSTRPAGAAGVERLWHLEQVGPGRYHGRCRDGALMRAFGGQVAAQALAAAGADLTDAWWPVSLHAYFVREGRSADPIEYTVDVLDEPDAAVRFRAVTASQAGRPILTLETCLRDAGDEPVPAPEPRPDPEAWTPGDADDARWLAERTRRMRFELRFASQPSTLAGRRGEVARAQRFWLRTCDPLPDHGPAHACALTYASDFFLVSTALATHGLPGHRPGIQAASLDHAVWFHRPVRADEWVLYEQDSPTSARGRGLSTGRMLDRAGQPVATIRQEVLLRVPL